MANYLITGASGGLGCELVKQLLASPAAQVANVFALSRSDLSGPLKDVLAQHPDRGRHVKVSIESDASVQKAAEEVAAQLGPEGLDVLVNNAGTARVNPGGTRTMPADQLAELMNVNVLGAHRVIQTFLPLLERGKQKKVISISSSVSSLAWADKFKHVPAQSYKISKTALNALNMHYALDHSQDGFTFLLVSPGYLKTNIGGDQADFEVQVGALEVKRIIMEAAPEQNGKFVNIHAPGFESARGHYDGKEIPW